LAADKPGATLGGAVRKLARMFEEAQLASPMLDARILTAEACGRDPSGLILDRDALLSADQTAQIASFAARRLAGEPVSRILGRREFWGLTFRITPDTLDPRPETELLVETVVEHVKAGGRPPHPSPLHSVEDNSSVPALLGERDRVSGASPQPALRILDLGTGSGCILGALLSELPDAQGMGIDRSEAALAVARDNLSRLGLQDRAAFLCADWMSATSGSFDVIVSNPPYIAPSEIRLLEPEVRDHDPNLALDGGQDGLDAYRALIPAALAALREGGLAVFEVGYRQGEAVLELMKNFAAGSDFSGFRVLQDFGGAGRAVAAVRQS
jgi:release factor glutamine methyltransferase